MSPRRILSWAPSAGRAAALAVAGAAVLSSLGCGGASSPTAPTPEAQAPNAHSIAGVVTDPGGSPVAGAAIEVVQGSATGRRVTAGADGRYTLDNLDAGTCTIAVSAEGFSPKRVDVDVSGATRVDVQLPPEDAGTPPSSGGPAPPGDPSETFTIHGRIQSEPPGVPEGAHIRITAGPNTGRSVNGAADGAYTFDDLQPGEATLVASAPGFGSLTRAIDLDEDEVIDFVLTPTGFAITGRVVDARSGTGLGDVRIAADGLGEATSDHAGDFRLGAASPDPTTTGLTLTGASIVERRTHARVPGDDVEISVIPAAFDLQAFDEMFRTPELRRWREAPRLIVERRAVEFAGEEMAAGTASGDPMTDVEVGSLATDLTWALPQLSGERFPRFADIVLRTTDEGANAQLLNDDVITVARVRGLTDATGFWGLSRWRYEPDGTVTGGLILLDADFDAGSSPYRRALRAHELGHALGYHHVASRPSVMNPAARLQPTEFDLHACQIAFAREPGNRSPDIDPDPVAVNRLGAARWSRPIK
jgi:hypothetical protein